MRKKGYSLDDLIGLIYTEKKEINNELRRHVIGMIETLGDREKHIIKSRVSGFTLRGIGMGLNISSTRVREIEIRAIRILRAMENPRTRQWYDHLSTRARSEILIHAWFLEIDVENIENFRWCCKNDLKFWYKKIINPKVLNIQEYKTYEQKKAALTIKTLNEVRVYLGHSEYKPEDIAPSEKEIEKAKRVLKRAGLLPPGDE